MNSESRLQGKGMSPFPCNPIPPRYTSASVLGF